MATWWDAVLTVLPIILGPGATAMIVAWLGYLKATREGKPAPTVGIAGMDAIGLMLGSRDGMEHASQAIEAMAAAAMKMAEEGGKLTKAVDELVEQMKELRHEMGRRGR